MQYVAYSKSYDIPLVGGITNLVPRVSSLLSFYVHSTS